MTCCINELPKEILLKILQYVVDESLLNIKDLNVVCSYWYDLCLNKCLWKRVDLARKRVSIDRFLTYALSRELFSNLHGLDFSGFIELTNAQLDAVIDGIRYETLKDLSIAHCKQIQSPVFVKLGNRFKKLKRLDIQGVIKFERDFNYDDLVHFFEKVGDSLLHLNISENTLDAKIFDYLFDYCTCLEHLDIWKSDIVNGAINFEQFGNKCKELRFFKACLKLQYSKPIEKLKINNCFMKLDTFHINASLRDNEQLFLNIINTFCKYSLNLHHVTVTYYKDVDVTHDCLFNCISSSTLKHFRLNVCLLSESSSDSLGLLIYRNANTLETLNLSNCAIMNFDQLFKKTVMKRLTDLNLCRCEMVKSKDFRCIGDYCTSLKKLNMSLIADQLEFEDMDYLFQRLGENLVDLNISENRIDSRMLASLIDNCRNLERLDLWGCNLNAIKIDLNDFAEKSRKMRILELIIENDIFVLSPDKPTRFFFQQMEAFHLRFKSYDSYDDAFLILSTFCKYSLNLKKLTISNYISNEEENGSIVNNKTNSIFDCINPYNLVAVDFRCCSFSEYESGLLVQLLNKCKSSLKELSLHGSTIKKDNLCTLIENLTNDTGFNLNYFGIKSNYITEKQKQGIRSKMKDIYYNGGYY